MLRKFRDNFVVIGFTLGLVYEGATILASGGENSFSASTGHGIFNLFPLRVALGWLTENSLTNHIISHDQDLGILLGWVLFLR